jgi:beta-glucuronidase
LYATDPAHISDITVVTDLDGDTGVVDYTIEAVADDLETRVILRDADGAEVATTTGPSGTLQVPGVHKWAPGDGYLYELDVQLIRGDTVVDSYPQGIGVRTVKVDGIRFLINGEPLYFTGFGKHEDLPVIGKGHNDAYLLHDFELLKWIGANSFRTSHYPYAEDVLDYADRQVVLIDETAAVGLNMGLGGGIFGGQGYKPSPQKRSTTTPSRFMLRRSAN